MTTLPSTGRTRWAPWVALVVGVAFVVGWNAALRDVRYPYFGDSASYIEMAESLREHGRPLVTPWGLEHPETDTIPQPLFPPGLPVIIAALTPLAGDARTASAWPNRIAAALLPFLIVVLFRGYAPDVALLGVGFWVLLSPGVLGWHGVAYSDVACLGFAVVALGALLRADGRDRRWLAAAGFAAGVAYTVRNAALAVLVASAATLAWEWLRSGGRTWRNVVAWGAGAAVPLGALAAYDLATFGALQPYHMPPSFRPWPTNLADWVGAQLHDLHVPFVLVRDLGPLAAALVLAVVVAAVASWWWRTREDDRTHRLITALGGYAAAGGALLVISRSKYEWADTIEVRHTLQYSWALALLAVVAARALPARWRRALGALAALVLAGAVVQAGVELRDERAGEPEAWLVVARDPEVVDAIRAIPEGTFIGSNASVLFRIATGRAVRLDEFGGGDAALAKALAEVRDAAGPRPSAYVLWCHDWTQTASACAPVARDEGPRCTRLRGPPQIVAICSTAPEDVAPVSSAATTR